MAWQNTPPTKQQWIDSDGFWHVKFKDDYIGHEIYTIVEIVEEGNPFSSNDGRLVACESRFFKRFYLDDPPDGLQWKQVETP